ncbi:MAG: hypothetical protein ACRC62_29160, partial [Microcoleus sp.]
GLFHHPQTADLFICFLVQDVGRCEIYWLGSSSLVSAPFRLLVETLFICYHCLLPDLAQDCRHLKFYLKCCGFLEFTRFFTTRYRIELLCHFSFWLLTFAGVHYSRPLCH